MASVLWFGWSGRLSGDNALKSTTSRSIGGAVTFVAVDLTESEYDGYLNGFSSGTLWPLLHDLPDRVRFHAEDLAAYRAVNAMYVDRLVPLLRPSDRIWIQDYHLIPMAALLRQAGITNPIGLFLHVPFPAPQGLLGWPWHKTLASDLSAYDLVGFQTRHDELNFEKFMPSASTAFSTASRAPRPRLSRIAHGTAGGRRADQRSVHDLWLDAGARHLLEAAEALGGGTLSSGPCGPGDAAARRRQPRRQGICRRPEPARSRRVDPVALCRSRGTAHRGAAGRAARPRADDGRPARRPRHALR